MQTASYSKSVSRAPSGALWARCVILVVLAFEGLGALWGGPLLVAAPDGSLLSMSTEVLRGAFSDFLVPGWALTGLGVVSVVAFVAVLLRRPHSRLWVLAALGGFLIWFVVELWLVGYSHVAQIIWSVPVLVGGIAVARLSEAPSRE